MRSNDLPAMAICFTVGVLLGLSLLAVASDVLFGVAFGVGLYVAAFVVVARFREARRHRTRHAVDQ